MLWAITSYFNPAGYRSRRANYRTFRRHLQVPLVAVELSFNGQFELEPGDADILVQRVGRDVLWQKERLLNVALRSLPRDCREVAWLDCDIVFADDDWPEHTRHALDSFSLVQIFRERCNLARGATIDLPNGGPVDSVFESIAYKIATGRASPDDLRNPNAPLIHRSTTGLAWAARRASLEQHGLYDAGILGTGDRAILCAALGEFECGMEAMQLTGRWAEHYLAWAEPFFATMRGKVGSVDGRVFHLWHGDLRDRNYAKRYDGLKRSGFDPFTDIALDASGCWRWSTGKRDMHEYIAGYFGSRSEDGVPAEA